MWKDKELAIKIYRIEEFSEAKLLYIALSTMKAIEYLHSKNIYYGDIKPANIFIFQNMQVKLGNFATAKRFEDKSSTLHLRGTT